ncbi:hypothetical protein [Flavobacterium sp. '19STA2R22 D10 B1']|uniref:hypothetical protein n=1 Tax=Flavobacterium aerium TaxID=3037261 RepID=UPI00278BD25C|nr:hypothetical protein [Flavobacterium sp. '19STA2R22 D10 B1']
MQKQKIFIVAHYAYGYIDYIIEELKSRENIEVDFFYFGVKKYKYKSFFQKIENFFSKTFLKKNLKDQWLEQDIRSKMKGHYDTIFVIRPDMLSDSIHRMLKKNSNYYITYLFDNFKRMPKQAHILPFFDKVFSYEKEDCAKYQLEFATNYITTENYKSDTFEYLLYNIATFDERFGILKKIAVFLDNKKISFKFRLYTPNEKEDSLIDFFHNHMAISEVLDEIKKAKIIIDIQREGQLGLTFRVFEALGNNKKLITTNIDIVNYNFYNPKNIYVIDDKNPIIEIPEDFIKSDYEIIDDIILNQYRLPFWVDRVFFK